MRIKVRIQESIAHGWLVEDSGKDVFFICVPALEKMLKRPLSYGEELTVDIPELLEIR